VTEGLKTVIPGASENAAAFGSARNLPYLASGYVKNLSTVCKKSLKIGQPSLLPGTIDALGNPDHDGLAGIMRIPPIENLVQAAPPRVRSVCSPAHGAE
jgi:hypothetical protein